MILQIRAAQAGEITAAVLLIYRSGPAAFAVTCDRKSTLPNVDHHRRMEKSLYSSNGR